MAFKVATGPTTEPFTTAFVKDWLKIPSSVTAEDSIVAALIESARVWAEQTTKRALMTQTIEEYYDGWPCNYVFTLSVAPIQSVTSISYLSGGSYTTWASSNYSTDLVTEPCRIVPKLTSSIPNYDLNVPNAIKIIYVAGAPATTAIPQNIKHAMLQKIAYMYENREDMPQGGNSSTRQRSADALLQPQRML